MIPLDEARTLVLSRCEPLPVEDADIRDMAGRPLAADVVSVEDVPPFDNSAVDGFAVQSADVAAPPVELDVVATVAAGATSPVAVARGQAVRIMTGAPIPAGADAVVMVEDSQPVAGGRVRLTAPAQPGGAIREAGSDVRAGDTVFRAGTVVGAAAIGVLASINVRSVPARRRARVAVLATGDELVVDGSPLAPGQIRESNLTMLRQLLADAGCAVEDLGVVRDDEALLEDVLRGAARRCDAIVTSGGVSMGDFDVVKAVLSRIADMQWMQVAIKPAKPFAFGTLDGGSGRRVPVFGLPGNPVSSVVSFEMFARPALRRMMGHERDLLRPVVRAVLDAPVRRKPDGKLHLVRVHGSFGPDGRLHVRDTGPQGSHQLASTAVANGLALVPDGAGLAAGDDVEVLLLD
ncbi:MAG: molybdopterin molybdotransferase MoeA [Acidobacteria bacterium]|nr:molybdopterin molybdotransferase MoeA [Acidobacteriota bacterium]